MKKSLVWCVVGLVLFQACSGWGEAFFGPRAGTYQVDAFSFELFIPEEIELTSVRIDQKVIYASQAGWALPMWTADGVLQNELSSTYERDGERVVVRVGAGQMEIPIRHPQVNSPLTRADFDVTLCLRDQEGIAQRLIIRALRCVDGDRSLRWARRGTVAGKVRPRLNGAQVDGNLMNPYGSRVENPRWGDPLRVLHLMDEMVVKGDTGRTFAKGDECTTILDLRLTMSKTYSSNPRLPGNETEVVTVEIPASISQNPPPSVELHGRFLRSWSLSWEDARMSIEEENPNTEVGGVLSKVDLQAELIVHTESTGELWKLTIDLLPPNSQPAHRIGMVRNPHYRYHELRRSLNAMWTIDFETIGPVEDSRIWSDGFYARGNCTYEKLDPEDRRSRFLSLYDE